MHDVPLKLRPLAAPVACVIKRSLFASNIIWMHNANILAELKIIAVVRLADFDLSQDCLQSALGSTSDGGGGHIIVHPAAPREIATRIASTALFLNLKLSLPLRSQIVAIERRPSCLSMQSNIPLFAFILHEAH